MIVRITMIILYLPMFRRAAIAGVGAAAQNLASFYAIGRGVIRSKKKVMIWTRAAAETGQIESCELIARFIYLDRPYAREIGLVEEAARVTVPAEIMEDLIDIPKDVLKNVLYWSRKGGHDAVTVINSYRTIALEGEKYCFNEGCEVKGHLKDFKVCPQCKTTRYCSDVCQEHDWLPVLATATVEGRPGHKGTCGGYPSHGCVRLSFENAKLK